ncbi:MAG: AbgT family transporter [Gammaproteobacteria bacterium]
MTKRTIETGASVSLNLNKLLNIVERAGNALPNPAILFVYLCLIVLFLSAFMSWLGFSAVHPVTGDLVETVNLFSVFGLHRILTDTVSNFTSFAPVGTVLVAIMGIGVAEHAGLIAVLLRTIVVQTPRQLLTFTVVLAGVLSSLAADTGYVVLIPLAALAFISVGRHPITGIAAAFAGVSGGFSANLLIGPLDVLLAGLSTEAAALIQPDYTVNAAGNYYFIIVSTLLVSLVGTWVTEHIVSPRLPAHQGTATAMETPSEADKKGLRAVGLFSLVFVLLLLAGLLPDTGILRDQATGSVLRSPFISGIVTIIALYAALAGIIFGRCSGRYASVNEFIDGMEKHMATMAAYLVLMFFAAQFVSYFAWSNLGGIIAIKGAGLLTQLQLHPGLLLVVFIVMAGVINLFIGSATAKWGLIGPIFVPMFLLLGISPEAAQMAYRIGDSSTNIITPLMPYFGVVVAFARQHDKTAGIGTIIAMMLPYSLAFLCSWSLLLLLWVVLDLPLGPGVGIYLSQ